MSFASDSYPLQVRLKADTTYREFSGPPQGGRYVLGDKEARVIHVFLAPEHHLGSLVVLLTDVFEQLGVRPPAQVEYVRRPRLRVGAGVVDRHLILHLVHVGPREPLRELELRRMRCAAGIDPELLVQAARFDDEGVAVPFADRVPVVARRQILGEVAAIEVDRPVRVRTAVVHDVHALQLGDVDELGAVRRRELPRHARRLAPGMRLELVDLTDVIDRARPRLERDVVEDPRRQGRDAGAPAANGLAGDRAHDRLTIGPARSRWRRRSRCTTGASPTATTATAAAAAAPRRRLSVARRCLSRRRVTTCWCWCL